MVHCYYLSWGRGGGCFSQLLGSHFYINKAKLTQTRPVLARIDNELIDRVTVLGYKIWHGRRSKRCRCRFKCQSLATVKHGKPRKKNRMRKKTKRIVRLFSGIEILETAVEIPIKH